MLAKRCSLLAHALSTTHVPAQKKPFFQRNFEMTADLKQKHATCRLSNHRVPWHPWSTINSGMRKKICVAPWRLPDGPYTIRNFFHIPEKKSHLAPPTLLECLRKKNRELKKMQICMECDRMWNLQGFRQELHLPGHFSWTRKKRNNKKKNSPGGKR